MTPEILYSEATIAQRVDELAQEIARNIEGEFMLVALLKGSFMFAADLSRALHRIGCDIQVDFLGLSSYGAGKESSKKVTITQELKAEVAGKKLLIIDDILESGRTLKFAQNLLSARGAKSVSIAVFLEKPGKRAVTIDADFVGYSIPDKFVIGYGLDYASQYRQLPYIGVLNQH